MSEVGEIWALEEEVADGFGDVAATAVWRCFELETVLVNIEEGVSGKNLGYGIGKIHVRDSAARLWRWEEGTLMLPLLEQTHSLVHKL